MSYPRWYEKVTVNDGCTHYMFQRLAHRPGRAEGVVCRVGVSVAPRHSRQAIALALVRARQDLRDMVKLHLQEAQHLSSDKQYDEQGHAASIQRGN